MATSNSSNLTQSVGYKIDIDDTIKLTCKIEASESNGDHIVRKYYSTWVLGFNYKFFLHDSIEFCFVSYHIK